MRVINNGKRNMGISSRKLRILRKPCDSKRDIVIRPREGFEGGEASSTA